MVVDNLLTAEECDHMIKLAEVRLEPSTVVNVKDGSSMPSTVRTSYGSFLNAAPSDTVDRVNNRLADLTMLPPENGEAIQVRKKQCVLLAVLCARRLKGIVLVVSQCVYCTLRAMGTPKPLKPCAANLLQVLRYEIGQYYRPHHDFFADEINKRRGGQRVWCAALHGDLCKVYRDTLGHSVGDECA